MLRKFFDCWRGEVRDMQEEIKAFTGPGFSSESMRLMAHYENKFAHLLSKTAIDVSGGCIADARDTEDAMLRIIKPEYHDVFKEPRP